jgi:hypothetical protein
MNIVCLVGTVLEVYDETVMIDVTNQNYLGVKEIITIYLPSSHANNPISIGDLVGIKAKIKTENSNILLVYEKFEIL